MDPLAEQFPSWTPYHYVHNNPINLIDPTGMSAEGRIGEENFKNVVSDLKQIGDSKITYANKSNLNSKNIIRGGNDDGLYSNTRNVTYDLTKPYGQNNRVTAEFYSNKSNNSGKKATALESAVKIIWAIFKKVIV